MFAVCLEKKLLLSGSGVRVLRCNFQGGKWVEGGGGEVADLVGEGLKKGSVVLLDVGIDACHLLSDS
jgi:hypothetical protein